MSDKTTLRGDALHDTIKVKVKSISSLKTSPAKIFGRGIDNQ